MNFTLTSPIVADGDGRWRRSAAYLDQKAALKAQFELQHANERASASWLGRWWIDLKIRLAVHRELSRRFPPGRSFLR